MPKRILGLSAYYHDSAAALVVDGEIVAAAQEERFTRKKHDAGFPRHAALWCLKEGGVEPAALDAVAFYDKPLLKFERLFETYLDFAPRGFRSFLKAMPLWMREKLWMKDRIREELAFPGEILFAEHHESHAASAFFPSPYEEAAVLTMDGVGEWATSSIGHGKGASLDMLLELRFPHSVGLLYSAFTYFCGFKVNSGEYKLMGLAPYGEPRFADVIRREVVEVHDDGSIRLDLDKLEFAHGLTMTGRAFERLFGGPARARGVAPDAARDGPRGVRAGRHRGDRPEDGPAREGAHGRQAPLPRRRRRAELRRERGAPARAGSSKTSSSSRLQGTREGPWARPWRSGTAGWAGRGRARRSSGRGASPAAGGGLPPYADGMKGAFLGPAFSPDEIAAWLRAKGPAVPDGAARGAPGRRRRPSRRREGRRPAAGADGVRAARPRGAQHPGRPALSEDAVGHEPEDQVPRVVPALRAVRPPRGRRRSGSSTTATPPTCS